MEKELEGTKNLFWISYSYTLVYLEIQLHKFGNDLLIADNSNTIARIFQNMRIEIFKRLELKVLIEGVMVTGCVRCLAAAAGNLE